MPPGSFYRWSIWLIMMPCAGAGFAFSTGARLSRAGPLENGFEYYFAGPELMAFDDANDLWVADWHDGPRADTGQTRSCGRSAGRAQQLGSVQDVSDSPELDGDRHHYRPPDYAHAHRCAEMGGALATVHSGEENEALFKHATSDFFDAMSKTGQSPLRNAR